MRIRDEYNDTKTRQERANAFDGVIKKEDEENRCRFNFDFRPIQIDRGSLLHSCSISL